jgi:4-amino-4-deoxy-L-arabinose transferase-like glycosyltransferase
LRRCFRTAFSCHGRLDGVLLSLFLVVNALVLGNAVVYEPGLGYDAYQHERYVGALARGHLPGPRESREFFSPPLPYAAPALAVALGARLLPSIKAAQLLNVVFSMGLGLVVLLLAEEMRPGSRIVKRVALALLGLMAVYPRTFSFFRAEPLLALLATLGLLLALRLFAPPEGSRRLGLGLGVVLGLMMLARQQGVFVLLAVGLFALARAGAEPARRRAHLRDLVVVAAITAAVGSWFYLSLWGRFGSPLTFNKKREAVALENRPEDFYLGTGDGLLFSDPVRPSFKGQFGPVLYADAWGDYYGYFLIYAWDARRGRYIPQPEWEAVLEKKRGRPWLVTNRFDIAPYLGRVNFVSLLPSGLMLVGLGLGLARLPRLLAKDLARGEATLALLALCTVLSLLGYFTVLLTLPTVEVPGRPQTLGTTIKASYVLQVFPWLALLGAEAAARLHARRPRAFPVLAAALVLVALHNAPTLVTAYGTDPASENARSEDPEPSRPESSPDS